MTTFTTFQPPPNNSFSFQPTLDGNSCDAVVWWNVDGQRWYVSVTQQNGQSLFNLPLIGSPQPKLISSLTWANGIVKAATIDPHGFKFLSTFPLTLSGNSPEAYNGIFDCFITGDNTFTYKLAANPSGLAAVSSKDEATALGIVSFDINIGAGYLSESTFVYRPTSNQFEVSP